MDGVVVTKLSRITHPKGDIYHVMQKSSSGYQGFGEAYFSTISYDEIKGWKKHLDMTLNVTVPVGEIEFVITDGNEFMNISLSTENYVRLTIPPGYWVAFRGIGQGLNLLLNIANIEHDPSEAINKSLQDIDYAW